MIDSRLTKSQLKWRFETPLKNLSIEPQYGKQLSHQTTKENWHSTSSPCISKIILFPPSLLPSLPHSFLVILFRSGQKICPLFKLPSLTGRFLSKIHVRSQQITLQLNNSLMLSNCLNFCSEPSLLFQRDLGRHRSQPTERSPINKRLIEKVSLRSVKSLKNIKSLKTLPLSANESLSPRVSLKTIESSQKSTRNATESHFFEAFRNPFENAEKNKGNPVARKQPEIKVHFSFEPPLPQMPQRDEDVPKQKPESPIFQIQIHNECDISIDPSEASSFLFENNELSTIREEEKSDMMSTHISANRLLVKGSIMKPKSVVSMMSSKSDAESVLLQRTYTMEKLTTLF